MGKHSYAVVLDAGSSGTRVYVYRWKSIEYVRLQKDKSELRKLPKIKTEKNWRKKIHPGVSTFGSTPDLVGPDHLKPLLDFALNIVPKEDVSSTPIFLLATAGVRLLEQTQRATLLNSICSYFRQASDFQLPDCDLHVQVIEGETEGLYGWIAANYLLESLDAQEKHDHGKGHHTYGFLDMGGASAQIAFAPNATETVKHAKDLTLLRLRTMNGTELEHRVFVTTWLGFGANEARRRYVDQLIQSYPAGKELPDPCLPGGLHVNATGHEMLSFVPNDGQAHIIGTGNFPECVKRTFPLLQKDEPCRDPPCLLNGIHTPAIDFDVNHFVGVSEFWHTTHEVFAKAHEEKAYDFETYQKQVIELCSRDWSDIKKDVAKHVWGAKVDEKTVEEVCFKASWLINMLHDGVGIPRYAVDKKYPSTTNKTEKIIDNAKDRGFLDSFQAVDKLEGTEVSWTLGKAVLYASSQIPAEDETKPVGFGSNRPGVDVPFDFHYPSVLNATGVPSKGSSNYASDDDNDWHDRIFSGSYSRRVPGLLIFVIILALAVYLLCGRERRASWWNKAFSRSNGGGRPRKRKAAGLGQLFGPNNGPAYERVDEADDLEMELGSIAGSSVDENEPPAASPPRTGRTSGVATPAIRGLSPDHTRGAAKLKGYFDRAPVPTTLVNGLGINRLASRSRNTSPARSLKSPLPTGPHTPHTPFGFKTSLD